MKKVIFLFIVGVIGVGGFLVFFLGNTSAQLDETWEDFEEGLLWKPVDWENVRKVELSLSRENASSGSQALRVDVKEEAIGWKNKVALYRTDNLDLRDTVILLDVYIPESSGAAIAVGFSTGSDWTYFESTQKKLKQGWNKNVSFDLNKMKFKARQSNWKYTLSLIEAGDTRRVFILIYKTLRMRPESIYIDNIRLKFKKKLAELDLLYSFLRHSFSSFHSTIAKKWSGFFSNEITFAQTLSSPELLKISPLKKDISKYEKFELAIELKADFKNPFDPEEINLYCEFLSPTGKKIIVPGFLYSATFYNKEIQNPQWRIRFAPEEEGVWQYQVFLKTPNGEDESQRETFQCLASPSKGFIRISQLDPLYFEFDNGEFYYPIGENVAWARLSGFEKYFGEMHKVGGNWSRVWMASWEVALEWTGNDYYGLGFYNLKNAKKLDKILEIAKKNDIYIQLVLNHHGQLSTKVNSQWRENPYNIENGGPCKTPQEFFTNKEAKKLFKNRLRYIVARWGYSSNIFAWELWNELTYVDGFNLETDYLWHKEMSEYLKSMDPFKHLVTTSYAGTLYDYSLNPDVWRLKTIDFTQFHMYTVDIVEAINGAYRLMSNFGKPYFMAEAGRGTEEGFDAEDRQGSNLHAALWSQFMTPSAGNAMPWWWDSYIQPKGLYYHWAALTKFAQDLDRRRKNYKFDIAKTKGKVDQKEIPLYIQGILNKQEAFLWIYDLDWTKFSPFRKEASLIEEVMVRLEGMAYGTYLIEFWDTYNGEIVDSKKVNTSQGGIEFFVPAFKKDLAVKIRLTNLISLGQKQPHIVDVAPVDVKTSFKKILARRVNRPITIDGDLSDWPIKKIPLEYKGVISSQIDSFVNKGKIDSNDDCSAVFYTLFDDKFIYFAAFVRDDSIVGRQSGIDIWRDDCVEVWIDTRNGASEFNNMPFNPNCYQINFAPLTKNKPLASTYAYRNFNTPPVTKKTKVSSKVFKDGYIIEAAIPIASLNGLDLSEDNTIIGFNVSLVDRDEPENEWNHVIWSGFKEDDAVGWGYLQFKN